MKLRFAPGSQPSTLQIPLIALLSYVNEAKSLVQALKYRNRRSSLQWLGSELAGMTHAVAFDAVTWVPCSRSGRRERGFDPAQLLAKEVAKSCGVPAVRTLRRRAGPRQSSRSRTERLLGPDLVLIRRRLPQRLLLIDDVCTTGASLQKASVLLDGTGDATCVAAAVAAVTPEHSRWGSSIADGCV